jgi:hypothetical protein
MNRLNQVLTVAYAMAFAGALAYMGPAIDSKSTTDAQISAKTELRRDLAAAELCREEFGNGATFTFTASNELVCIPVQSKQVASK